MDIELISEDRYYLRKLSRYLNYQLSTSLLCFFSYAWVITLVLAIIAAAVFAPFMLYIFYKTRKISWIISFIIIVMVPMVICIFLGLQFGNLSAFVLIPLGFFYLYCFIIKLILNDQLEEIIAGEELEKQISEEQKEKELWQSQVNNEI